MSSLETVAENASLLVEHFGKWPSFHDAEVIDFHCWRGRMKPGVWDDSNILPIITMKILVLRAVQSGDDQTKPDIAVTFRFHDAGHIKIEDFNHINFTRSITVTTTAGETMANGRKLPPSLSVSISSYFGMTASFRCMRIEVVDAVPFDSLAEPRPTA